MAVEKEFASYSQCPLQRLYEELTEVYGNWLRSKSTKADSQKCRVLERYRKGPAESTSSFLLV